MQQNAENIGAFAMLKGIGTNSGPPFSGALPDRRRL
jgi:hypothetical protein